MDTNNPTNEVETEFILRDGTVHRRTVPYSSRSHVSIRKSYAINRKDYSFTLTCIGWKHGRNRSNPILIVYTEAPALVDDVKVSPKRVDISA